MIISDSEGYPHGDGISYGPVEPFVLRVTFGVQYAREPHPTLEWAHPDGWFEIVVLGINDIDAAYEIAVEHARLTTGGVYAFDYRPMSWSEISAEQLALWHPYGVLARLTLDYGKGLRAVESSLEVFRRFRPTMREVDG